MKVISLTKIADEAGYIAERDRHLMGAIQNPRTFEQNFAALDQQHRGGFAFLAFHPASDESVVQYVADGTLGDDAGAHVLALFLAGEGVTITVPKEIRRSDAQHGVHLSMDTHPAYALANHFFLDEARPRLPGLVFFDALATPTQAIYVPLDGNEKAQVKLACRTAFDAASRSIRKPEDPSLTKAVQLDFDRLAARLVEQHVNYRRAGEKGLRAAAFYAGAWIKTNAGAIVAAIPKLVGLAGKASSGGAST